MTIAQVFTQQEDEPIKWDAFQIHGQFQIVGAGRSPVDASLRVEYSRRLSLTAPNQLEARLILSRQIDKVAVTLNPVYGMTWAPGSPVTIAGFDTGIGVQVSESFSIAVESTTRHQFANSDPSLTESHFGPTIGLTAEGISFLVGYLRALTDDGDDTQLQFLVGIGL
ncbi:MAG: hypothetical protein AB1644_05575 [Candidatus Zixiibacteriota bacterium]